MPDQTRYPSRMQVQILKSVSHQSGFFSKWLSILHSSSINWIINIQTMHWIHHWFEHTYKMFPEYFFYIFNFLTVIKWHHIEAIKNVKRNYRWLRSQKKVKHTIMIFFIKTSKQNKLSFKLPLRFNIKIINNKKKLNSY